MPSSDDYLGLLTPYHRTRPRFAATVVASVQPLADLQALLGTMGAAFDLDQAVGAQLDAVGLWVGISRNLVLPVDDYFFSFDTAGLGYDEGVWFARYDSPTQIVSLDDDSYRFIIRAKIAANGWDGSNEGLVGLLDYIFPDPGTVAYVRDNQDMTMTLVITGTLPPPITIALITRGYVPIVPATVAITYEIG